MTPVSPAPPPQNPRPRWLERALLAGTGVLAAAAGWQLGAPMIEALRELWLHNLLPAFLSLHLSGLTFCH